ncbi:MAG: DNA-directed RNA polymerase subunit omega [Ruminococcaceae bacterium]|nr:DNA-directed RNA polymerase subunit omega [Oscillospiraceae bacterium]
MINPPINELTKNGKYNRYELVIATAKAARMINDEYIEDCEKAEQNGLKKEIRDEKFVRTAITKLNNNEYRIVEEAEAEN